MKRKIVFATNNEHKLAELRELVGERFEILSLADIDCYGDIPEDCPTLEGNARQKAEWINRRYGIDCFSDDTGLEIDALDGEPGVHSARYGGVAHDSERNIDKVLSKLQGVPQARRTARFRTVVCLILDGEEHLFEGKVEGEILTERRGEGGFGYDSIFHPFEADRTFAQMSAHDKNAISHRGRAVAKLVDFLSNL